jgi:hypothetical protein
MAAGRHDSVKQVRRRAEFNVYSVPMSDTIKIRRPLFPRREGGPGGRVEHDERGNAVWVRTRAGDSAGVPDTSALSMMDEEATKDTNRKLAPRNMPAKPRRG